VAHSLGGLVCATAVVLGERNAIGDSVQQVAEHIRGIIFMGTPFAGSNIAKWGELARRIFNVVAKTDKNTLKTLKEDSNDLKELGVAFPEVVRKRNDAGRKINIVFFYEELDTYGQRVCISDMTIEEVDAYSHKIRSLRRDRRHTPALARPSLSVPIIVKYANLHLRTRMATNW